MTEAPLRRNREFGLLQAGQLLSNLGSQLSAIAYPLLALTITHSPAKAGVVSFARTLGVLVAAMPAGLAADRWNRKTVMIVADLVGVLSLGTLATLLLVHHEVFAVLPIVALVEGAGSALFLAAEPGAMRAVVPTTQLPAASAIVTGREGAVSAGGPALGGLLFGVTRSLPFVADAASYLMSSVSLLLIRTPFQQGQELDPASVRQRLTEGVRYLWSRPFLRTCALLFGLTNFIIPGQLLALVVLADRRGLSGGVVGGLVAAFGFAVLVGSFISPLVRRVLPVRAVLLLEFWSYLSVAAFLIWPNVYVLAGSLVPTALAIPSSDAVVHGYRIALTPDRLVGRVESVRTMISLSISPLGPLLAGLLLSATSPRATMSVFFGASVLATVWGTLSPAIRAAPSFDDLTIVP